MSRSDEKYPPLTTDQQAMVVAALDHARAYVIVKYKPRDEEAMENLLAEAHLALVVAASRFDPDKGVKFFTYARWWIFKMCNEFIGRDYTIVPSWDIIRSVEQPELIANVPLENETDEISSDILDLFGVTEDGYDEVENSLFARWYLTKVAPNYSPETLAAWRKWKTFERQTLTDDEWACVFLLDDELNEGLE
jgi:DNA-directed RNA polymerase specialized sigma subunit